MKHALKRFGVTSNAAAYGDEIVPPCIAFAVGKGGGGHWVTVEEDKGDYLIFDPYGTPPSKFYDLPLPKKERRIIWSAITGQKLGRPYCGLYCIAFLKARQSHDWATASSVVLPDRKRDRDNTITLRKILGEEPDAILFGYGYKPNPNF